MNINREHLAFYNVVHVKVVEQKCPVNDSVCSLYSTALEFHNLLFHCFVLRKDHCCGKDLPSTYPGDSSIKRHGSFETELYGRNTNLDPQNPARGKEPVSQKNNLPIYRIVQLNFLVSYMFFTYSRR